LIRHSFLKEKKNVFLKTYVSTMIKKKDGTDFAPIATAETVLTAHNRVTGNMSKASRA